MTADYRVQALEDPTAVIHDLYHSHALPDSFPHFVAEHFSKLFETSTAFNRIPTLNVSLPPESHQDRALVRFRAMVQDTSLSTEMYLSKHDNGTCGGWGIYASGGESSSSGRDVDYTKLRECNVLWATTVPAESEWCAAELDDHALGYAVTPSDTVSSQRTHKYPHDSEHIGIQIKIYDRACAEAFKSTDIVTFVGILSSEPCGLDHAHETSSDVPTLHVLFTKSHVPNVLPRPFPRVVRQARPGHMSGSSPDGASMADTQDNVRLRTELIDWIADEALGGDRQAAEWVLLSCISRVQSRHPPLLPAPLVVSQFPRPPPVSSTSGSPVIPDPTLSAVLTLLLPLTHTLALSLESLNKARYTPESTDEDLHAGVLQLPQGTVLLISEGGVQEGQLLERGVKNVRALQEVMNAQTLAYIFPYSQFSFPTDITCVILAEGRKSAFFHTELNIPLRACTDPASIAALYKPADQLRLPSQEKLAAFRDLVVGARCGKVQVPEATSEHIQSQFVEQRRSDRSVTADDLIRWMTVSKLYALSIHEPVLSVETWQRAKAFDDQRRSLLT